MKYSQKCSGFLLKKVTRFKDRRAVVTSYICTTVRLSKQCHEIFINQLETHGLCETTVQDGQSMENDLQLVVSGSLSEQRDKKLLGVATNLYVISDMDSIIPLYQIIVQGEGLQLIGEEEKEKKVIFILYCCMVSDK